MITASDIIAGTAKPKCIAAQLATGRQSKVWAGQSVRLALALRRCPPAPVPASMARPPAF